VRLFARVPGPAVGKAVVTEFRQRRIGETLLLRLPEDELQVKVLLAPPVSEAQTQAAAAAVRSVLETHDDAEHLGHELDPGES